MPQNRAAIAWKMGQKGAQLPSDANERETIAYKAGAKGVILPGLDVGQQVAFDPEGSGFDMATAKDSGDVGTLNPEDNKIHFGSIDPRTGMLLKGMKHPTIQKAIAAEEARGNTIVKRSDGRYYSVKADLSPIKEAMGQPTSRVGSKPISAREKAEAEAQNLIERKIVGGEIKAVDPSFGQKFMSELPASAGAAAATITAAPFIPPQWKWPAKMGTMALAALTGSTIAETAKQAHRYLWKGQNFSRKEIKNAAIRETLMQPIGDAAGALAKGGFSAAKSIPGMSQLSDKVAEAAKNFSGTMGKTVDIAARKSLRAGDVFLTGGQLTNSRVLQNLESFVKGSYTGGGRLWTMHHVLQPAALKQMAKDFVGNLWGTAGKEMSETEVQGMFRSVMLGKFDGLKKQFASKAIRGRVALESDVLGTHVAKNMVGTKESYHSAAKQSYNSFKKLAQENIKPRKVTITKTVPTKFGPFDITEDEVSRKIVNLGNARKFADISQRQAEKSGMGESDLIAKVMKKFLEGNPQRVDVITASNNVRSDLLAEARKLAGNTDISNKTHPRLFAKINELTRYVDSATDMALKKENPSLLPALKSARQDWKMYKEFYDDTFVQKLAKVADQSPQDLTKTIFVPGAKNNIVKAKAALGEKAFKKVGDNWLTETVESALSDPKDIGLALKKKLNKVGRPALVEAFGEDQVDDLYALGDTYIGKRVREFERDAVQQAIKQAESDPAFLNKIFQPKNTADIKFYKSQMSGRDFNALRASWMENKFKTSDKKLSTVVREMGDTLETIFPDREHIRAIKDVAMMDDVVLKTMKTETTMLPRLIEAGIVAGMATQPAKTLKQGGAKAIAGFTGLGALLSHKKSAVWLAKGVKNPEKMEFYTSQAVDALIRSSAAGYRASDALPSKERARSIIEARRRTPKPQGITPRR